MQWGRSDNNYRWFVSHSIAVDTSLVVLVYPPGTRIPQRSNGCVSVSVLNRALGFSYAREHTLLCYVTRNARQCDPTCSLTDIRTISVQFGAKCARVLCRAPALKHTHTITLTRTHFTIGKRPRNNGNVIQMRLIRLLSFDITHTATHQNSTTLERTHTRVLRYAQPNANRTGSETD